MCIRDSWSSIIIPFFSIFLFVDSVGTREFLIVFAIDDVPIVSVNILLFDSISLSSYYCGVVIVSDYVISFFSTPVNFYKAVSFIFYYFSKKYNEMCIRDSFKVIQHEKEHEKLVEIYTSRNSLRLFNYYAIDAVICESTLVEIL